MNRTTLNLGAFLLCLVLMPPVAQAGPIEDVGDRVFGITDCFVFGPCNTDAEDADGDHVPDGLEPAICQIEADADSVDGSCNAASTDYEAPLP